MYGIEETITHQSSQLCFENLSFSLPRPIVSELIIRGEITEENQLAVVDHGPARFSGECDSEKPPYMAPEPIIGQLFGHVGPPGAEVSEDPVPHSGNVPTFLQAMGVEADSQLANFELVIDNHTCTWKGRHADGCIEVQHDSSTLWIKYPP